MKVECSRIIAIEHFETGYTIGQSIVECRNHPHQYDYQTCKVGQDRSRIFWGIWHDMPIFAVSPQKVLLLTA